MGVRLRSAQAITVSTKKEESNLVSLVSATAEAQADAPAGQLIGLVEGIEPLAIPEGVDDNQFSIHDLYDPRSKYNAEQKMAAAMAYVISGNSKQASRICGIPDATIRWWKASAAWWPNAIAKCFKDKNDSVDAAMTEAIEVGMGNILDMLKNGEYVLDKGKLVRKPASLRDTYIGVATLQDKRQILRGEPTSISSTKDKTQQIQDILKQFEEFSKGLKNGGK